MTGLNSVKHGAFGFNFLDLTDYSSVGTNVVNSYLYRGKTIFDYLGQRGKWIISFGIPLAIQ